jgi:hypothetical protein
MKSDQEIEAEEVAKAERELRGNQSQTSGVRSDWVLAIGAILLGLIFICGVTGIFVLLWALIPLVILVVLIGIFVRHGKLRK